MNTITFSIVTTICIIAIVAAAVSMVKIKLLNAKLHKLGIDAALAQERAEMMTRQLQDGNNNRERFTAIATEVLQANSRQFNELSRQQIAELLAPMKENLDEFRRNYTESYGHESEKRAMLQQQLNELFAINRSIGEETRRLTDALKGNAGVQGQWGEMVLENILERSGLLKGQDYEIQRTVDDSESRARPDIIIRCPGNRNIVVDSKVSISDYLRMLNATDRQSLKAAGDAHVASVRKHVAELRRKNYQDLLNGNNPDFVMMFIPHEGAYIAAMQLDSNLWQSAFDSRVIIVSPTHLVSVVKLVELMWRQDKQNRNAVEIAQTGTKILDKLANFLTDMQRINSSLEGARRAYDAAMTKLEGRGGLRSLGETMRDKGIKAAKDLPERTVQ